MINELIKIMFSGFWPFVGVMMLLGLISNFIFRMYNRTLRFFNIRKHGYPPEHCDADGDFITILKEDEDD